MVRRACRDGLSVAVMSKVSGFSVGVTTLVSAFVGSTHERVLRYQGRPSARHNGTSSRSQQTTTPQERAAAAVPALRRGADNEQTYGEPAYLAYHRSA